MKAIDVCVFLIFLNIGISAMAVSIGGTGLFGGTPGDMGMAPGEMSSTGPENIPGGGHWGTIGNFLTGNGANSIVAFIGAIIATATLAGVFTSASVTRLAGISLFAGAFWWAWTETNIILSNLMPVEAQWLINIFTAIYGVVFLVATIEFLTGQRIERY